MLWKPFFGRSRDSSASRWARFDFGCQGLCGRFTSLHTSSLCHAGTLMQKQVSEILTPEASLMCGDLFVLYPLQMQSPKPNLSEFRELSQPGLESVSDVNVVMAHQNLPRIQMMNEENRRRSGTRAAKPPRPSPLQLDVRGQCALSTSIKPSTSFKFSTSPTTSSSSSAAYKSFNYFSPILKRRSLGWSGQRLARIKTESSGGCKSIGFAHL